MPSKTRENYLKALYHLHVKEPAIGVSELGEELQVSTPTANDMVKKLHQAGYVQYEKYKPILLTEKGIQSAALIIRKHRLAEIFLTQVMGFGWEEVHDIAEELEHIKSVHFFDRIDELLGYPTADPHGSPIPDREGRIRKLDYVALSTVEQGQKVTLRALRDSSKAFLLFLNRKQLHLGVTIVVEEIEPFDGSRVISYPAGGRQHLSYVVCERLLVSL